MIFKHQLTQPQAPAEMQVLQLVKKDFDKLVDGGASSPARCRVSNLRFEPSAVSPSAKPENPLGFQPSCHPHQFLLKSFRFPGAKTAKKRFLRWKMGFSAAKILPCPPYMPLGTIELREGLALSISPRVFRQSEAPAEMQVLFSCGIYTGCPAFLGGRNCRGRPLTGAGSSLTMDAAAITRAREASAREETLL